MKKQNKHRELLRHRPASCGPRLRISGAVQVAFAHCLGLGLEGGGCGGGVGGFEMAP